MVDIGFSDVLSLAQTIGIMATLVLTFYFSKRQIQSLSVDVETRILNDLDEKLRRNSEMLIEHPEMLEVIYADRPSNWRRETIFSYYILFMLSHVYHMRRRKVLRDNEWAGWVQWMKNAFLYGTIQNDWKEMEMGSWFDPAFRNFIDREIMPAVQK
jgi:hypothetical protein